MRFIIKNILLIIISLTVTDSFAVGKKSYEIDIDWSLESKGVYSSGISDSYAYNITGAKASYKSDYLGIASSINQYFNYQITDGNGVYDYRSFSEAGVSMEFIIHKYFNLLGEYTRSEDFNNLAKNSYYGSIEFEIASSTISAGYSYEQFNYEIDSKNIENINKVFFLGVDYIINDFIGIDLTYTYNTIYFNSLGNNYSKNIFRVGCMYVPSGKIFLMSGAGGGKDSEEYNIYGTDFGITLFIYSHFKVTFSYYFNYYDPTVTKSYSSSSGGGPGNGNSSNGKGNPYLLTEKEGEAYYSHVVSFGVTASF